MVAFEIGFILPNGEDGEVGSYHPFDLLGDESPEEDKRVFTDDFTDSFPDPKDPEHLIHKGKFRRIYIHSTGSVAVVASVPRDYVNHPRSEQQRKQEVLAFVTEEDPIYELAIYSGSSATATLVVVRFDS